MHLRINAFAHYSPKLCDGLESLAGFAGIPRFGPLRIRNGVMDVE